jgi:undecaprenyl-diphosphatase
MIDKQQICKQRFGKGSLAVLTAIVVLGLAAVLGFFFLDEWTISRVSEQSGNWYENDWVEALRYLGKAWAPIWLLLVWMRFGNRPRAALAGLLALLLIMPLVLPLKVVVGRPRPKEVIAASPQMKEQNAIPPGHSFPSGDTATVFAVATVLAGFVGWLWMAVLFIVATCVGLLRIVVLAHYPSDVSSGAAIGIFCGWLALEIDRRWVLLEPARLKQGLTIALLGVITIPFLLWLFEGFDRFLLFLKNYVAVTVVICLITKAGTWRKRLREGALR